MVQFLQPVPPARTTGDPGLVQDYNALRTAVLELRSALLQDAAEVDERVRELLNQRLATVALTGRYADVVGLPSGQNPTVDTGFGNEYGENYGGDPATGSTSPGYGGGYGSRYGGKAATVSAGFGARFGARFGSAAT